jgi:hypothetical protein
MLLAVLEQASQPPASEFTTFSSTNASVVYTFFTLFNAALNSPF